MPRPPRLRQRPRLRRRPDLARLQRDRASAIREVPLVERTDPSGATTRVTWLKLADKSLALTRFLRVCGIESLAHEGGEEGVQELLSRPEKEVLRRVRAWKGYGGGAGARFTRTADLLVVRIAAACSKGANVCKS